MNQTPYSLDPDGRAALLEALREVSLHRGWNLLAAHVRTNHVHVIVDADVRPERVMNDFKSYASRGLNRLGRDGPDRKRWARHGSTRWLWKDQDVQEAIRYVVEEQGDPISPWIKSPLSGATIDGGNSGSSFGPWADAVQSPAECGFRLV